MEAGGASSAGKPFSFPDANIGDLKADSVAVLIAATADIAMVLDYDGAIRDISLGVDFADSPIAGWVGRSLEDTVTVESRQKVADLIASATTGGARWRQVNHTLRDGTDLPVRYIVLRLGDGEHLVAFGQDQRTLASLQQRLVEAQQSVEREYAQLRLVETRYRLMFQMTGEAVLIVDSASGKVLECNPAAEALIAASVKQINGKSINKFFDARSHEALDSFFDKLRAEGKASPVTCQMTGAANPVTVAGTMFRQDGKPLMLLRMLTPNGVAAEGSDGLGLAALIENMPDPFVITDGRHRVLSANTAFLDLTQMASPEQLKNQPLDRWLGRTEVDFKVLMNTLAEKGAVRRYATAVRGELGASEEIEASVVAHHRGDYDCFGFVLRQVPGTGLASSSSSGDPDLHRSVEKLAELVGRVPLRDIVRETTDMIERMCIEAALDLTDDNRASAADVLGLSRQSLYVKLRRFGLRDFEPSPGDD